MIQQELTAVADVLRKLGYPPAYVLAANKLLLKLFPEETVGFSTGLIFLGDRHQQHCQRIPAAWIETRDGKVLDLSLPQIARRISLKRRMPRFAFNAPKALSRILRVNYAPDGPGLRETLRPDEIEELSRLQAKYRLSIETAEERDLLIALRDEAIEVRCQRVRITVPAALRDRAKALRPIRREFERQDRRELAHLIGQEVRISGEVGQARGPERCLLQVVDTTGRRLADHLWVKVGRGEPGDRLTLNGTVHRYETPRGPDFGLKRLSCVQLKTPQNRIAASSAQ